MKNKTYELHLPIFEQGEDLEHAIDETNTLEEAFEFQAAHYEAAAAMCHRMAQVVADTEDISVETVGHYISVDGPIDRLEELHDQGLLCCCNDEETEDDEVSKKELN